MERLDVSDSMMTLRKRLADLAIRLPFVDDPEGGRDDWGGTGDESDASTDVNGERAGDEGASADGTPTFDGDGTEVAVDGGSATGPELLSRPDRLLYMLETHDGRLRQQEIITETGWSSSTVSRHLRRLEDDGRVVRVLVKGEYLVLLPEADTSPGGVARQSVTG